MLFRIFINSSFDFFSRLGRFLKFSCWLPVYFVARLLGINTFPLLPSEMNEMIETGELANNPYWSSCTRFFQRYREMG